LYSYRLFNGFTIMPACIHGDVNLTSACCMFGIPIMC
jgi:hypothetical protein